MSILGAALIAVLLSLAALHLYWGVGGRWPGHDEISLLLRVSGAKSGRMYGLGACVAVALALSFAAAIVYARQSATLPYQFAWIVQAGYGVMILVFGGRGLAPYVTRVFDYARDTPFFNLNRRYYAPLCLLIAAALVADFLVA